MPRLLSHRFARSWELLASRHFVWFIIAAAILLGLPTLDVELFGDDLVQQDFLRRQHAGESSAPWWNMFSLVEGPRTRNIGMRTSGRYPWWVDPDLHIVFFRPLTVLTHHVDHWLWPRTLWLMHLHSVMWHALACALGWAIARRLFEDRALASLAALIFTVSATHVMPVTWLAHRNGLVSTAFALGALLAHDHWRRDRRKLGGVLAPISILGALLSAEAGVVIVGYLVAYAVFLDRGSWSSRLLALVPGLVVVGGWLLAYSKAGFGATASGAYLDPFSDPRGFALSFPGRYLWLLGSSVSPPLLAVEMLGWLWIGATLVIALAVVVFVSVDASRVARFGLLAVVLGCIPLTTSHPGPRLLVLTSFGAALVFAELLDRWLFAPVEARPILRRSAGGLVLLVHLLIPPAVGVFMSELLGEHKPSGAASAYGEALPNEGLRRKGLVIVHAPNFVSAEYLPVARLSRGLEPPNFKWLLHEGPIPPEVTQVDASTLELHDPRGWPAEGISEYWRSTTLAPFVVGETIKTVDFVAEVREVDERGKAVRVRFQFRAKLDSPTFVWTRWEGHDYVPLAPAAL
ncbi:MAG: hypothetical protein R6X02_20150 [Enhygromyxa sp.]